MPLSPAAACSRAAAPRFLRSGGDKGFAVDPRTDPAATVAHETSYVSTPGSRQVSGPVRQLGPRSDEPRTAGRRQAGRGRAGAPVG